MKLMESGYEQMEIGNKLNSGSQQNNLALKIIGVGGAGCSSSERAAALLPNPLDVLYLDRDIKTKDRNGDGELLYLPLGDGVQSQPEYLDSQYSQMADEVRCFVHGADIVLVLAGLGRGMGSVVAPLVAETARNSGALTIASINMPFEFEGRIRTQAAIQALKRLRNISDTVLIMKNDDLCNPYGDKVPVREALQSADRNMTDIVQDVMNVLSASKNRINELKRTLEECGESAVVSATAIGLHAGRTAALKALGDSSLIPTVTNNVLLHIQGGIGFSIGQAAEAFSVVRKVVGPDAKIEMSTQRELSFGIDVRVTVMLMGNDLESVQDLGEFTKLNRLSAERSLSIFENPNPVRRRPPILLPTG